MNALVRILGGRTPAAKVAGVAPQTVGNWTSGRSKPDAAYVAKLRRAARKQANQADTAQAAPLAPPVPAAPLGAPDTAEPSRPRGLYALPSPGASSAAGGAAAPATPPPAQKSRPSMPAPSGADLPAWLKKRQEAMARIKPLTQAEAQKLRVSFIRSLKAFWGYADEGITYSNRQRAEAHIWRKVDDEETEMLADWLIDAALRSAPVAQMVRGVSRIWDYYAVGLILGPRFIETWRFYAAHGGFSL